MELRRMASLKRTTFRQWTIGLILVATTFVAVVFAELKRGIPIGENSIVQIRTRKREVTYHLPYIVRLGCDQPPRQVNNWSIDLGRLAIQRVEVTPRLAVPVDE